MYICVECEKVFEEPKIIEEHHPYGDTYATEYFGVCPYCKGDIQEAEECSRCGEWVFETEDGLCEICYGDLYD